MDSVRQKIIYEKAAERVAAIRMSSIDGLNKIENELKRRKWSSAPDVWAKDKLGDTLWSGQVRIMRSVATHRKTAAMTCHDVGKSYSAGIITAWWLDIHDPGTAFVVTSAPTGPQVQAILWREIGRVHTRGKLLGRVNQTEWLMDVNGKEEIVAFGRKPSDYDPTAFQGIHAPFVLFILDEACGMPDLLWEAADSLIANDNGKALAIGNPDDPLTEFARVCKPNSGWNVVQIGAFDSPNFTGEDVPEHVKSQLIGRLYVEEKRKKLAPTWSWSEDGTKVIPPEGKTLFEDAHPVWVSKVLGFFPADSTNGGLIPLTWILAAQKRTLDPIGVSELGLDVGASEGGDPSCCGHRRGSVFRILYEERQPDTMKTTGKLIQHLKDPKLNAQCAKVDYIGVGRGVVDRCREQNLPVYPVSVGEAGTIMSCLSCKHEWDTIGQILTNKERCPKCNSKFVQAVFANLLAQLWWSVRTRFETGDIDIDAEDEQLAEELLTLSWEPNSKGQTTVKYSNDAPSPNRADSLLIAFAPALDRRAVQTFVSW